MTTALAPVTLDVMTGRELRELIAPVLAHADSSRFAHPKFTLVDCEVDGGTLYLAATDRYTLGITCHPVPEAQNHIRGSITVPAAALRTVLRTAKARDRLLMSLDRRGITVTHAGGDGLSHHIPASPMDFPLNWRGWFGTKLHNPAAPGSALALDPRKLARFAPAVRNGWPLEVRQTTGGHGPVLVTCGDHFLGVIMPIRLPDEDKPGRSADPLTTWQAICPDTPATTGQAA